MTIQVTNSEVRQAVKDFELRGLFNGLGWDNFSDQQYITVADTSGDEQYYELNAIAQKRGMIVFTVVAEAGDSLPDSATRKKIERELSKLYTEHFVVYASADKGEQVWQWAKREAGKPTTVREHRFENGDPTENLVQRIQGIAFSIDEEDDLDTLDVFGRVQASFDVEKVTKKFYENFKKEHDAFLKFIQGLDGMEEKEWYASIMLNRLMFVYFIQRKGFLDGNQNYLSDKLKQMQSENIDGGFLTFYRRFLLKLFHDGLGQVESGRDPKVDEIIGEVPYLNGGLFDLHTIEESNPDLDIPDEAFERVFDFFGKYDWHLDERPLKNSNEINPDVLGYIFEKYVNQKQMGAYYTQEDVTGYISQNTIVPYLFDAAKEGCAVAFEPGSAMWSLLSENPDRYIYETVLKGVDKPLPEEIAAGVDDVSARGGWNRPADEDYALPTETWREHVARRQRCEDLRDKLSSGSIHEVNDLITYNLNIRQFAQDVVENAEGPELVRAFYEALKNISVLDPTCGSGAFLFAALNILEPLYEACLERMQQFKDEDTSGEKYKDFRRTIAEMERHVNQRYFILKSIMIKNLYGVDIMEEAVEIARLRMFLKLMAQVEGRDEVEPLPDLDFNLRTGNTLVGFASMKELRNTPVRKFDFEIFIEKIEKEAASAEAAFQQFREMQMDEAADSGDFRQTKAELRERLVSLTDQLNLYLAAEYSIKPDDSGAFEAWRESHQPFHWFVEFHEIIESGGFDVIIGNPPYVEYKDVRASYTVRGFDTLACGDLYAYVTERCYELAGENRLIGLIVPISIFNTDGFASLQRVSEKALDVAWASFYANRPAQLFDGAQKRLTILIGRMGTNKTLLLNRTGYLRWRKDERDGLFPTRITHLSSSAAFRVFPASLEKLGGTTEGVIFDKLILAQDSLEGGLARTGNFPVYYTRKFGYFLAFLDFVPEVRDLQSGERKLPTELKYLRFRSRRAAYAVIAALSSTTFFWFWNTLSDCRNLNKRDLLAFPFDPEKAPGDFTDRLEEIGEQYVRELRKTSRFMLKSGSRIETFNYAACKPLLDQADRVLAEHYGFTDEELDFIINFDIKYRMGSEQS